MSDFLRGFIFALSDIVAVLLFNVCVNFPWSPLLSAGRQANLQVAVAKSMGFYVQAKGLQKALKGQGGDSWHLEGGLKAGAKMICSHHSMIKMVTMATRTMAIYSKHESS